MEDTVPFLAKKDDFFLLDISKCTFISSVSSRNERREREIRERDWRKRRG